jgi:hypothetical protein
LIKQVKFNIIQIQDNLIVGGHKAIFLFEGATCQKLTRKKEGCGMKLWNISKGEPQPSKEGKELITTM